MAARTGRRASALRYFEAEGLLPVAARQGGRRVYDLSVLDRLTVIELAQSVGLSIREIRELLRGLGRRQSAASRWRRLATTKLAALDAQIARATAMRTLLTALMDCACPTLDDCGRALRTDRREPRRR